jgi:nitroreductase
MNVREAVVSRRAIQWYDPNHKMPEETFTRLMEQALLAPTAFNIQNWRFVRVTDPGGNARLSARPPGTRPR